MEEELVISGLMTALGGMNETSLLVLLSQRNTFLVIQYLGIPSLHVLSMFISYTNCSMVFKLNKVMVKVSVRVDGITYM